MTTNLDEILDSVDTEQSAKGTASDEFGTPFNIYIKNKRNGNKDIIEVYPAHTLDDILQVAKELIGIRVKEKVNFISERTGESRSDLSVTVAEFGLCAGDTLVIIDDSPAGAN